MMHPVRMASSGTKLYGGVCDHPDHGRIHVIGYSNELVNTYGGPNCMIIHIPSRERMSKENFVNPYETEGVLSAMSEAVFPPPPPPPFDPFTAIIGASRSADVQHFSVGDYEVILADEPGAIPSALEQIFVEKRPVINDEVFFWYKENMPGWHIALFCFSTKRFRSKPVFYWYHPLEGHEDVLRLPAIDSHDGTPPRLGESVYVNHELFVSWPGIDGFEMDYSSRMSGDAKAFMPKEVAGVTMSGHFPNGDFGIEVGVPTNGLIGHDDVRRLSLPGSKVRF